MTEMVEMVEMIDADQELADQLIQQGFFRPCSVEDPIDGGVVCAQTVEQVKAIQSSEKRIFALVPIRSGLLLDGRLPYRECEDPQSTFLEIYFDMRPGAYPNSIEEDVDIHPSASIGPAGARYIKLNGGSFWEPWPHIGNVEIEQGASVGSNSVIHRALFGATHIGRDTHVGSLCSIGHNTIIGDHCILTAHVAIAGSCVIGERCWFGIGSIVRHKIKICDDVIIGAGAVVVNDISEPGTYVGNPARKLQDKSIECGQYCVIEDGVAIGKNVKIGHFVLLKRGTVIGDGCNIDSYVKTSGDCVIENDVTLRYNTTIAREVRVKRGAFLAPNVSTEFTDARGGKSKRSTTIGRNAFIGSGATIAPGIQIADNVTIASMAYVNRNCSTPGGVYGGVPAKRIKKREDMSDYGSFIPQFGRIRRPG